MWLEQRQKCVASFITGMLKRLCLHRTAYVVRYPNMSKEKTRHNFPALRETLSPIEQLYVASDNLVDLHGVERDSPNDRKEVEVEWYDDNLKLHFELERTMHAKRYITTMYQLRVYPSLSDTPQEYYRYTKGLNWVDKCDEDGDPVDKDNHTEAIPIMLKYLQSDSIPSLLTPEEQQQFTEVMALNDIRKQRLPGRLRYFAQSVLRSSRLDRPK